MSPTSPRICLIDDDAGVRTSLQLMMRTVDMPLDAYASGKQFLTEYPVQDLDCVLLNVRMPELSGMEVLHRLRGMGSAAPVIFVTGYASVDLAVQLMQAGAFDVLEKPFHEDMLLDLVGQAIAFAVQMRQIRKEKATLLGRLERLTRREAEVLDLMVEGQKNVDIARTLEISPKTLDIHRTKVLEKLGARTVADAVRWRIFARLPEESWPGSVGYL